DDLCERTGDTNNCHETWRTLKEENPENPVACLHWGMALEARGAYDEARAAYEKALSAGHDAGSARIRLGGVLACLDQAQTGIAMIQEAVSEAASLKGQAAWTCQNAGRILLERNAPEAAARLYRLAAEYVPDEAFYWLQLGVCFHLLDAVPDAVAAWRQAVVVASASPAALESARKLDQTLNTEERLAFWRGVSEEQPDAPLPRLHYGFALMESDAPDALDFASALARQHGDLPDARMLYGLALCRAGESEAGLAVIASVIKEKPELKNEAAARLSAAADKYIRSQRYEIASHLLAAAASFEPDNLAHTVALGEALLGADRLEEAAEQFFKVLMIVPEASRSARFMDEAYRRMNATEARRSAWQEIAAAHPDAELPKQRLGANIE
ncbi:MAG TPA: tetratricopeptide repeat protein, partial [Candidatus Hydrogenedentes bacterium]|nr:tetratricopeptide repeat protein [Candidatus Hydrogenedentota bacterium]